jgi:hypothetical protein
MTVSRSSRSIRAAAFGILLVTGAALSTRPVPAATGSRPKATATATLPSRLSDGEFWKLVSDISEPGGFFRITDNYTSNEREVGQVSTMLRETGVRGGVYLGVGPEQNFSYIAAIRPVMAFIIDIRRQAVMQHLMFKAVFELAPDRADFISQLFSKPRPAGLDGTTSIQRIWDAFTSVATDPAAGAKTYARMVELLTKTHHFTFTADESEQLQSVFQAFQAYGPSISTRGGGGGVTFADLTGWSTDATGQPQSFLSTEENYRYVKSLQDRNLIVPASGDFGGPKTIRAIGAYLHEHAGIVSAFYLSNVEQYLFQESKQAAFYDNVATLPANERSVFIRPYSLRGRFSGTAQPLCPITPFIGAMRAGRVFSNNDALACVR